MKKLFVLAASAAMIFASCSKVANTQDDNLAQVTIKLVGGQQTTRSIEGMGATAEGTITVKANTGYVYVINPLGAVIHKEPLLAAASDPTGQILKNESNPIEVPSDSRVYILTNVPAAQITGLASLTTWDAIKAVTADVAATQTNYREATLANSTGAPEAIKLGTAGTNGARDMYTANIALKPLISRLELVALRGGTSSDGAKISGFDVTGVYVDSYYPSFTYNGFGTGTRFDQLQSTTFTQATAFKDETTVQAKDASGTMIASPDNTETATVTEVWAYNVAPSPFGSGVDTNPIDVPRLIMKLENVTYLPDGGTAGDDDVPMEGVYYLTITSYDSLTAFVRGNIYRIGDATNNPLTFSKDDLGGTPNPINVNLTVKVTVTEWAIEYPNANL